MNHPEPEHQFILPLYIHTTKKKRKGLGQSLSMNNLLYKHREHVRKIKQAYQKNLYPGLDVISQMNWPIDIRYTIFPKYKSDLGNYGSMIDKFFLDALVQSNRIPDDNYDYVKRIVFEFGEKQFHSPHCVATIRKYQEW